MVPTAVNVVVSCTSRKTLPVPPGLHLYSVAASNLDARFAEWSRRLDNAPVSSVTCLELYAGDHWSVVRGLREEGLARGMDIRVWVCSAGYGLLNPHSFVKPYAATFSPGHPDSVSAQSPSSARHQVARAWWDRLARWAGPCNGEPRSFESLALQNPRIPLLFFLAPEYLDAVEVDLERAVGQLQEPEFSTIFTTEPGTHASLQRHLVPLDSRLLRVVGGTRHSLYARTARLVLKHAPEWGLGCSRLRDRVVRQYVELARQEVPARQRLDDDAIREFVVEALVVAPNLGATSILGKLRASGFACEQSRFKTIFLEVREKVDYDA